VLPAWLVSITQLPGPPNVTMEPEIEHADLVEVGSMLKLSALLRAELDRLIAGVEPGHQIPQQIPDAIPAGPQVKAVRGQAAFGRGRHDVPQQRRLAVSAG
jgi:hypothetical protein